MPATAKMPTPMAPHMPPTPWTEKTSSAVVDGQAVAQERGTEADGAGHEADDERAADGHEAGRRGDGHEAGHGAGRGAHDADLAALAR